MYFVIARVGREALRLSARKRRALFERYARCTTSAALKRFRAFVARRKRNDASLSNGVVSNEMSIALPR